MTDKDKELVWALWIGRGNEERMSPWYFNQAYGNETDQVAKLANLPDWEVWEYLQERVTA